MIYCVGLAVFKDSSARVRALHSILLDLLPQVRKANAARLHMREDEKAQEREEVGIFVFLLLRSYSEWVCYIPSSCYVIYILYICLIVCVT